MINHLPDELLLEIFDSYRQGIDPHNHQWKKNHTWINLTHVCRKWCAVMFASSSRLDLITVGPKKPGHIKTILSGHLPILIDYKCMHEDLTGRHSDITIAFARSPLQEREPGSTNSSERPMTPLLESLSLRFRFSDKQKLPDTFLRGPDLSDLHLRRLSLSHVSLSSVSGYLSSATALTNLFLLIDTALSPSAETSLLACLQGMPCLRRLDLSISSKSPSQPPTPNDIVTLSKLTYFRYVGHNVFLDALVAGLSAPSLRNVDIEFVDTTRTIWPIVHLPRFINEIEERYHAFHMVLQCQDFRLMLLPESGHCKLRLHFKSGLHRRHFPDSLMRMSNALSARLSTVEKLRITLKKKPTILWVDNIPWRRFLQQFPSVKALRTKGVKKHARILVQDREGPNDDLPFLPALEELVIHETRIQLGSELATFLSARQRPVKLFLGT
jgi:hypothetical protein